MRERPARRRGVADSESGSSESAATSSDSDAKNEPPAKKKTVVSVCSLYSYLIFIIYALSCSLIEMQRIEMLENGIYCN